MIQMKTPAIERRKVTLPKTLTADLQRAVRNERTLEERWIEARGWNACHIDDGNLVRFAASTLIRCCHVLGVDRLYAVATADLFCSYLGKVELRIVPLNLEAINQACFGLHSSFKDHVDEDWFLKKAWAPSLFFPMIEPLPMLVMYDASTCTTIAGNDEFLDCMVKRSKRTWFEGVPEDGHSYGGDRIVRAAINRT